MSALREVRADGWCVRLDLSEQMLGLEVPEFEYGRFPDEGMLLPTLRALDAGSVSASALLLKAKQFDDGLYAAVDLAAQGRFSGKAALLGSLAMSLCAGLPESADAAASIHAACDLGGIGIEIPASIQDRVRGLVAGFLRDEQCSKPLGFYTWTPELSAIFCQDRFLQQPLEANVADELLRALDGTPGAATMHDAWLRLNARLTNPPARPGLREGAKLRSFLPASRSHEQLLLERLYGDRPIPDNFELMDELIRRVRSGEIGLAPIGESGWYDHQTWSLEPLIVPDKIPEAAHLTLGQRYRKHLEDVFRSALALTRETHVKQMAIAMGGCGGPQRSIIVRPGLNVEPLPTMYARKAASYRFIHWVLEEAFGADALAGLHRLTPEGPCEPPLVDELTFMEKLFDGAAATARQELGMAAGTNDAENAPWFTGWSAHLTTDRDLSRDCRMMVPVFIDLGRHRMKVWAFLGWQTTPVDVQYLTKPVVIDVERERQPDPEPTDRLAFLRKKYRKQPDAEPNEPPRIEFSGERHDFAVPVMAEVYVSRLLDRDEFRAHCDRHKTSDRILANLR